MKIVIRNTVILLAILVFGLCSCYRNTRRKDDPLTCRISATQTPFSPGDIVKINYAIGNTGSEAVELPLHYLDGRLVCAPVKRQPTVVPSLEMKSEHLGVIEFDNLGTHSYLPPPENKNIPAQGKLTGIIVFDVNSSFIVRKNNKIELLGGIDHDGLRIPGKYRICMVLHPGNHREIRSNEIEIEIKKEYKHLTKPSR